MLSAGARLGPYTVVGLLGAGGMGEVYRAKDSRLGREVAIKVVSSGHSDDPDYFKRLEREARAAAALGHPNVLAIHDVGTHEGAFYVVSELLEGRTLRDAIRDGLSHSTAIQYAIQIAHGLAAAHDRGIVHRDIKPENVFVAKGGRIKILDFGLAKNLEGIRGEVDADARTASVATAPGLLVGTTAYLAPEQISGRPADARSDIFALGVLLYETLAGCRPFRGQTAAETLAAILKEEPSHLVTADPSISIALDHVVRRCLEKEPERRWQSAHDLALALGAFSAGPLGDSAPPRWAGPSRRTLWWMPALLAVAAVVWTLHHGRPADDVRGRAPVTRFVLPLPEGTVIGDACPSVAISRDGTSIAVVGHRAGAEELYVRALDGWDWRRLPGTEGATAPFFSPDGKWLGFFAPGRFKRVAVAGGAAQAIHEVVGGRRGLGSAVWTDSGEILYYSWPQRGLWRVPANGGDAVQVKGTEAPSARPLWYRRPQVLADGDTLLFAAWTGGRATIAAASLAKGTRRTLLEAATDPTYIPSGHLIYGWDEQLMAAPFDRRTLAVAALPVPVLQAVRTAYGRGVATDYALSESGTLVYVSGRGLLRRMTWMDGTSAATDLPFPLAAYSLPVVARDGTHIAVGIAVGAARDVWVADLTRDTLSRVTSDGDASYSVWSADSQSVFVTSSAGGQYNIFRQRVDGSGAMERVTSSAHAQRPTSVSPDGRFLLFNDQGPANLGIWMVGLDGVAIPTPLIDTPANERYGLFSPDGKWVAYESDESGRFELYVQPFSGRGEKRQVSVEGASGFAWAPDGRAILYADGAQMLRVPFAPGDRARIGRPAPLFQVEMLETNDQRQEFTVAPDGRFLMLRAGSAAPTQVHVVVNWLAEVAAKVPAGH